MIRAALIAAGTLAIAGAAVFFGGEFHKLSAIRQHPAWVYYGLGVVRDTVIAIDAGSVAVPADFTPAADPEGAALYQKHCAQCHGAPGMPPDDFALGMMPVPPNIVHAALERPPDEVFWFIRYGLKMSGMPAWQDRMSEADMWRITALVEALPTLTPAAYAALVAEGGGPIDAVDPLPQGDIPQSVEFADPERGRIAMQLHACRSCHEIPGLVGSEVHVGPSLAEAGARRYIAGVLRNTPENMVRWIMDPQDVDPLTAMPDLDVTLGEARQMAAYLYSVAPERTAMGPVAAESGREPGSGEGVGFGLDLGGN